MIGFVLFGRQLPKLFFKGERLEGFLLSSLLLFIFTNKTGLFVCIEELIENSLNLNHGSCSGLEGYFLEN